MSDSYPDDLPVYCLLLSGLLLFLTVLYPAMTVSQAPQSPLPPELDNSVIVFGVIAFVLVPIIVLICCCRCIYNSLTISHTELYIEKWKRIDELARIEESRPLAIIYANSLLDHVLKASNYSGETMRQRLASAKDVFKNAENVQWANELRNKIAHEIDMQTLLKEDLNNALQYFRQALTDLHALK
ncbi:unnamed protein product [Adineta ricciae]|uniref:Uncharacterized protein n=1 Tax=Adineta ricciae TaxID=249248 RepID=A0A814YM45_ADIRI|nr:unnamed protein product [Adineta ricciae]